MLLSTIAKKQTLAKKATENPEYKFNRLYDLLHWETWIH
ncbi:hypothetical protein VCRA2128O305_130110 [Vibrio crassostreae]|uniref:Uncharacterized protein n=1 Tax=Vibrio crassostreae TaxID=246167 RepID=A0A4R3PH32_9VIBR|nr:hypothetical protein [Vibrio crassostreae]ROO50370.1 hypothetical protein EDB58_11294 [Vibrio crassostreae]TCL18255.1 hypothetical protein EDB52_12625 [Vibrio crassostreae]TCN05036.1 hypothetical protein EDB35_11929 [Vibrio crassostreae]TCN92663.1 hypothetical protein EDB50_11010 [Vibrio crassostreae]